MCQLWGPSEKDESVNLNKTYTHSAVGEYNKQRCSRVVDKVWGPKYGELRTKAYNGPRHRSH
jgi:hypothetical protein